jgi:ketosteroid isomerase-like protein
MRRTEEAEIAGIHSRWLALETAGEYEGLLALCSTDIEFRPPDSRPVSGKDAVRKMLESGETRIERIDIDGLHVVVGGSIAYLRANFVTTCRDAGTAKSEQISGTHLWVLQKREHRWVVSIVAWSTWSG